MCCTHSFLPSLCLPLPTLLFFPSGSSCPGWRLRAGGALTPSPAEGAESGGCGGPRPISVALEIRFQQHRGRGARPGPSGAGQRSFLLLCDPRPRREGLALPASLCVQSGQTQEPLGRALSAVLKEARSRPPPPPPPAAPLPRSPVSRPAPPRPHPLRRQAWAAAAAGCALSSRPARGLGIRPKRVLHPAVPALSCSRPPGRQRPGRGFSSPIGLQTGSY